MLPGPKNSAVALACAPCTVVQAILMEAESALAFESGAVCLTAASVDALMHPEKVGAGSPGPGNGYGT